LQQLKDIMRELLFWFQAERSEQKYLETWMQGENLNTQIHRAWIRNELQPCTTCN
jgi:hypothetical protein